MNETTHVINQKRSQRRHLMKGFVVSRYGKENSVEAVELPEPELGDGDHVDPHARASTGKGESVSMSASNRSALGAPAADAWIRFGTSPLHASGAGPAAPAVWVRLPAGGRLRPVAAC
jgi:hypothetical protein